MAALRQLLCQRKRKCLSFKMDRKEFFKLDRFNLISSIITILIFLYLNFIFPRYFNQNIRGIIFESIYYSGFPMIFYDVGFDVPGTYFYPVAFIVDIAILLIALYFAFFIRYKIRIKIKST